MFKQVTGALALAVLVGAAQGQEYTLKFKSYPDKGQTFVVKESDKGTTTSKIDVNGMTVNDDKKTAKEIEYDLKVVKPGDPKPAEFTRTYAKAENNENGKTTKLPYAGRTIIFTLNKDEYKVTAEGEPSLTDKDLADLVKQGKDPIAGLDPILDPGKKVKVGDTWNPDKEKLIEVFGKETFGKVDMDKSKVTGKLLKVYDKGKQQWGSIELVIEIVIKELSGPASALKFSEPAVLKMTLTIDRPIDGSSPVMLAKGKMNLAFKGSIEQGGMTINIDSKIASDLEHTTTEKKQHDQ